MTRTVLQRLLRPSAADFRHYGGFALGGAAAFSVDVGVLYVLTDILGWPPLLARPFSILSAMVASWWINRTVTFAVSQRPTVKEFVHFAAVVWFAQAVNYGVFAGIILALPETPPVLAVAGASLVSMCVSYMGYRYGVFRTAGGAES
jgi:putative flippase GtrA